MTMTEKQRTAIRTAIFDLILAELRTAVAAVDAGANPDDVNAELARRCEALKKRMPP